MFLTKCQNKYDNKSTQIDRNLIKKIWPVLNMQKCMSNEFRPHITYEKMFTEQ